MDTLISDLIAPILVGIITAAASVIVALINNKKTNAKIDNGRKQTEMENAKQRIISLISRDELYMHIGKFPKNYERVLSEYDLYVQDGGNSYIRDMIQEYSNEINEYEAQFTPKDN